jgi:hypothetical protein
VKRQGYGDQKRSQDWGHAFQQFPDPDVGFSGVAKSNFFVTNCFPDKHVTLISPVLPKPLSSRGWTGYGHDGPWFTVVGNQSNWSVFRQRKTCVTNSEGKLITKSTYNNSIRFFFWTQSTNFRCQLRLLMMWLECWHPGFEPNSNIGSCLLCSWTGLAPRIHKE